MLLGVILSGWMRSVRLFASGSIETYVITGSIGNFTVIMPPPITSVSVNCWHEWNRNQSFEERLSHERTE